MEATLEPRLSTGIKDLLYTAVMQGLHSLGLEHEVTIILNAQHKGGVGKTTTSVLESTYIADVLNDRVLLIDLDKQANLSGCFLPMEQDEFSSHGVNRSWMPPVHPEFGEYQLGNGRYCFADMFKPDPDGGVVGLIPYPTKNPNIDIVPAYSSELDKFITDSELFNTIYKDYPDFEARVAEFHSKLSVREEFQEHVKNTIVKSFQSLKDHIREMNSSPDTSMQGYKYIIIDTPPDKNLFIEGCMRACDHVIFTYFPDAFTLDGMVSMTRMLELQNRKRDSLGLKPVSFTIQPNKIHASKKKQLQDLDTFAEKFSRQMNIPIREHTSLTELITYKPTSVSFVDYYPRSSKEFKNIYSAMENLFGSKEQ